MVIVGVRRWLQVQWQREAGPGGQRVVATVRAWVRECRRAAVAQVSVRACARALCARATAMLVAALQDLAAGMVTGLWVCGWRSAGRGAACGCAGLQMLGCRSRGRANARARWLCV